MSNYIQAIAVLFATIVCMSPTGGAVAAEIKVLSTLGMKEVLDELGPRFERATGHKLAITFDSSGGVVKRIQGGQAADVAITSRQGVEGFLKDGAAPAGGAVQVARSSIGVAVRKGAAKPDISSADALKRALLAAKSITYSNPAGGGASGIHFAKVLDQLGIANEMKPKTVFLPKPGPVGVLVANGEAEIAVHQVPELIHVAGIEVVGPLPGDLQLTIVVWAAVMKSAGDAAAAKALVDFLLSPEAAQVIRAAGMEPG